MKNAVVLAGFLSLIGSTWEGAIGAERCANPVNSAEIAECGDRDAQSAEKELNQVYQQVMKGLAKVENEFAKDYPDMQGLKLRASLVAAEKEWLKYREQSCKLEGQVALSGNPNRGDSMSIAETGCKVQFARARTAELKGFAKTYDISLGL